MHLVSHFSSGFCVGSILYTFSRRIAGVSPLTFPLVIGTGAMLPDLDGISVFFNHKVYYRSFWYSHHGALHSLLGITPISLIFTLFIAIFGNRRTQYKLFYPPIPIFALLYLGNILHIIEDLPCPSGPWGGLMIFWPLSTKRFGGWSHIWWLNEYLMAVLSIGALSSLIILGIMAAWPSTRSKLLTTILIGNNISVLFLSFRFVLFSRYIDPIQWQKYQNVLLGDFLYNFVKSSNMMIKHIWIREIL